MESRKQNDNIEEIKSFILNIFLNKGVKNNEKDWIFCSFNLTKSYAPDDELQATSNDLSETHNSQYCDYKL